MNDNLKYRNKARIIGYIDLISISICLVGGLLLMVALSGGDISVKIDNISNNASDSGSKLTREIVEDKVGIRFEILMGMGCAYCFIMLVKLYAAIQLINLTEKEKTTPKEGQNAGKLWRDVSILMLLIEVALEAVVGYWLLIIASCFIRGSLIYFVWRFVCELDKCIEDGGYIALVGAKEESELSFKMWCLATLIFLLYVSKVILHVLYRVKHCNTEETFTDCDDNVRRSYYRV